VSHKVYVVGIGDDGPAGLSPAARQVVDAAEVLVGGRRHLAWFAASPAEKIVIGADVDAALDRVAAERARRQVVVLASGDPLLYGIGGRVVERCGADAVAIIPHVSAVQLAFARLGRPWQDAQVVSAHGRALDAVRRAAWRGGLLAVLTDEVNTPARIAAALLADGVPDSPAWVCEHLGGPAERVVATRLSTLPGQRFAALNVLVLDVSPPPPGWFGEPEEAYAAARGQITKAEVRAISLALLRPPTEGVIWDIGAGCGSVAIEVARLAPATRVYAVERDAEQLALLRANVRRHGRRNVQVVGGAAPGALVDLPPPGAVFVGGSGGRLAAILDLVAERLAPGGRVVVNAATLETVAAARECLARPGWEVRVTQVQVARGHALGPGLHLAALNPVFIVAGAKPGSGEREGLC
jgi:precorrin-6Y C5,15-methyltransferase (decarboxylating)